MATITIDIPDRLVALYQQARASYNAEAALKGWPPLGTPTRAIVTKWIKDWIKSRIIGEAVRTDLAPDTFEALVDELGTL